MPAPPPARPVPLTSAAPRPVVRVEPVYIIQYIGCWAFVFWMLSAQVNDWMLHLIGEKAYIYYVAYPIALAALVFCGTALRGVGTLTGKLWLLFGLWLLVDIPFSVWPSGSWNLLRPYLTRNLILFFVICGFAVNLRYIKLVMHSAIFGGLVVLAACMVFGSDENGRFHIPGSAFYDNANDLGIQLVVNIGFFAFLLSKKRIAARLLGMISILLSAFYILRTGSRGAFVGAVLLLVVSFVITKNKSAIVLMLLPMVLVVPFVSRHALERLVMIYAKPETVIVSENDEATVASQVSRQRLLRRSLEMTLRHPLFGVGPGQFIEATEGADRKRGQHSPALGTHNTYTEVSSECGIIALVIFVAALFGSLRKVRALHKRTRDKPEFREIAHMSYAMILSLAGFCSVALFHHMSYSGYPLYLTGMAIALCLAAEPVLAKENSPPPLAAPARAR